VWLADCRALLVEHKGAPAHACLVQYLVDCPDSPDAELAEALVEVATAMERGAPAANTPPTAPPPAAVDEPAAVRPAPPPPRAAFSVGQFVLGGAPELMLSSTLYGATAGFVSGGMLVSALRTREVDSLPALLTLPAVGAVAGLALSTTAWALLEPSPGDMAQISSAMLWGTLYGIVAQGLWELRSLDVDTDAQRTPWRFGIVLGTSALATASAAATAPFLDVDPGDIGLCNSAALWGGILPLFFMGMFEQPRDPVAVILLPVATSLLAYDLTLALSPLIRLPRPATWLIEVGGVLGLLVAAGTSPMLLYAGLPGQAMLGVMGLGTGAGAAAGAVASFVVAGLVDGSLEFGPLEQAAVLPTVLHDGRPGSAPLPGLSLVGTF
jgi:hypothetical protein